LVAIGSDYSFLIGKKGKKKERKEERKDGRKKRLFLSFLSVINVDNFCSKKLHHIYSYPYNKIHVW